MYLQHCKGQHITKVTMLLSYCLDPIQSNSLNVGVIWGLWHSGRKLCCFSGKAPSNKKWLSWKCPCFSFKIEFDWLNSSSCNFSYYAYVFDKNASHLSTWGRFSLTLSVIPESLFSTETPCCGFLPDGLKAVCLWQTQMFGANRNR